MRTPSILALVLLGAPACARAQTVTGAIRGVVEDQSAARVAHASIDLQRSGSSLTRHVVADDDGEFRVEGCLPGRGR